MIKPVIDGHISSEYGFRVIKLPGQKTASKSFHCGIDIAAPISDTEPKIVSPLEGTVFMIGLSPSFGNRVWIKITDGEYKGWYMVLAHMASLNPILKPGQIIKEGTFLGIMGNTGLSLGRHTHLEFRKSPSVPEIETNCKNPDLIRKLYK